MKIIEIYKKLPSALLPWYEENKRDLPWRKDRDPYHIWVSEIMLQQTRVEAVKGYYSRFLENLPTIQDLAKADDDALHKLWEGLGYYSRVRNLKKAAIEIVDQYDGKFPEDYKTVLSLPGIGEYTAGAICSIAFSQKTPAVDGNVLRVIARLTNDDTSIDFPAMKRSVNAQLAECYPDEAGEFTQALMELGATICGPNKAPDCDRCPCAAFCKGYQQGTAASLPTRTPKKPRKIEQLTVLILSCDGYYAVQKREDKGLLAGLWQFPNLSGKFDVPHVISCLEQNGVSVKEIMRQVERKHIFTHVQWDMNGIYLEVSSKSDGYQWFTAEEINNQIGLPTAFRQFWEELGNV